MADSTAIYYPPVGFYFKVEFSLTTSASSILNVNNLANKITKPSLSQLGVPADIDMCFQDVSGLTATVGTTDLAEGGENRFKHQLPGRVTYDKLVLKRGLVTDSAILQWCINAISNFEFKPITVFVKLLNESGDPLATWEVVNAYPTKWSVSNFNAEQSAMVVETLELAYQYFNIRL
ncbi:MAG: phage tail protein [Saprospiraceae bacterium]